MRSSSITWAPGCLPFISSLPPASLACFRGKGGKIPIYQVEDGGGEATHKWSHSRRHPAQMVQQYFNGQLQHCPDSATAHHTRIKICILYIIWCGTRTAFRPSHIYVVLCANTQTLIMILSRRCLGNFIFTKRLI